MCWGSPRHCRYKAGSCCGCWSSRRRRAGGDDQAATEFVTPLTFQTLSMNPVHTELFNLIASRNRHIALATGDSSSSPATANVIGKIANALPTTC